MSNIIGWTGEIAFVLAIVAGVIYALTAGTGDLRRARRKARERRIIQAWVDENRHVLKRRYR